MRSFAALLVETISKRQCHERIYEERFLIYFSLNIFLKKVNENITSKMSHDVELTLIDIIILLFMSDCFLKCIILYLQYNVILQYEYRSFQVTPL